MSAIYYFITAIVVLLFAFATFFILHRIVSILSVCCQDGDLKYCCAYFRLEYRQKCKEPCIRLCPDYSMRKGNF